ncbi:MAG: hypothetical protein JRG71_12795 [Deltaproteobacteria bacterium]|nr:hypothetical protein [Deltaproteobacteria bacterium]
MSNPFIKQVISKIGKISDNQAKGNAFENFLKIFFLRATEFVGIVKDVYLWRDWPQRWEEGPNGIDLVAEDIHGKYYAVQAKFRGENSSIKTSEIKNFIVSYHQCKTPFIGAFFVTTKKRLRKNHEELLRQSIPNIDIIYGYDLVTHDYEDLSDLETIFDIASHNNRKVIRLDDEKIERLISEYHRINGEYPKRNSVEVPGHAKLTWAQIDSALINGSDGLKNGRSLAIVLEQKFGVVTFRNKPKFSEDEILMWADAYKQRYGDWPNRAVGIIEESLVEDTWQAVHSALNEGARGLPGKDTLTKLIERNRHVERRTVKSALTVATIIDYADDHHEKTGTWPTKKSGKVLANNDETWGGIDKSLHEGFRTLPSGTTLAAILSEHRGVRSRKHTPSLSIQAILERADAHKQKYGVWPKKGSGDVFNSLGDTWNAYDLALSRGMRGLEGGSSLAKLLEAERGVKYLFSKSPLSNDQILDWADAHFAETKTWPNVNTGKLVLAPEENWKNIDSILRSGNKSRGITGNDSLPELLHRERGVVNQAKCRRLSEKEIAAWIKSYRDIYGKNPNRHSGPVLEASDVTWSQVASSLNMAKRGLTERSSISKISAKYC